MSAERAKASSSGPDRLRERTRRELLVTLTATPARFGFQGPDGESLELAGRVAEESRARIAQHLRSAALAGNSPGPALFGELFHGPAGELLAPLVTWATAAAGRRLCLLLSTSDAETSGWPLEILQHPLHGALGARAWCRVHPSPQGAVSRREVCERLARAAEAAAREARWEQAVCHLRALAWLEERDQGPRRRAATLLRLAHALSWTEGPAAALQAAEETERLARRGRDPMTRRSALRFQAELASQNGEEERAEALLTAALRSLGGRLEPARAQAVAEDRVWQLTRLFDRGEDRRAVRLVPAARRACRRAGRRDLEGRLDVATATVAQRRGWPWPARNLMLLGARRLAAGGRIGEAADAIVRLARLLVSGGSEEQALGACATALSAALAAPSPERERALEALVVPLVRDLLPALFDAHRPDLVTRFGLLLLVRWNAGRQGPDTLEAPPDTREPARLVVVWCGRLFRLLGWVAVQGVLTEEGQTRLVADRANRRAWRLAGELERLSGGHLPTRALHAAALRTAHRTIRQKA